MTTITRGTKSVSSSRRDAERHHRILLALSRATDEIRHIERESHPDIDAVLDRLLPDLAAALNAEQAFVAMLQEDEDEGKKWLELTAAYPRGDLLGHHLEWSDLLQQLVKDGKPRVIEPLGREARDPIPGLAIFDATSAILVQTQAAGQMRVVGICNKADPDLGPYLAADRMALDNIVELVAIGTRIGEMRRRELEGIQKTSAGISAELDLYELLPMIAKGAAEVFGAPATSLMLWDESRENLVIKASWGLSDEYIEQQRISREKAYTAISPSGEFLPFTVVDLRLEPFGQVEPIERERLCSMLVVPLEVASGEPIGALSIYSKDTPRQFTQDEKELARIFAHQAVIAIRNARAYQRVIQRVKAMESLEKVGRNIVADLDLHQVLRSIVENAIKVLEADIANVVLLDEGTNGEGLFGIANVRGTIKPLPREWRPQTEGLAVGVVKSKELLIVEDVESEKLAAKSKIVIAEKIQSFVCCPLLAGEDVLGLLYVDFCIPHRFTLDELLTIQMFANQAAIAIENARQHSELTRAYSELAELDERKSEFLSTVSHELRTPLTPIKSCIENLLSDMYGSINDRQRARLEMALASVNDEARLVENLLDLVRIQEGRVTLDLEYGNVADVINSIVQVFEYDADRKRIELQADVPIEDTLRTRFDGGKVKQVLTNLISNAIKFTPEKGTVIVSASSDEKWIKVQVKDTGIGIPENEQERIFDRFYQVDSALTRKVGGTGIGLNIVKEYVEMHGGRVWVESELGEAWS